jgi:nucleotide-binding universal stress UspA family protein
MYRHILVPTDGSQLSQNAIAHGLALAKSINAKVTILTVSTPFHTFAVEPEMVTDTPEQYAKHSAIRTAKYLNSAKEAAAAAGVNCDTVHVEHDHPYQASSTQRRGSHAILSSWPRTAGVEYLRSY